MSMSIILLQYQKIALRDLSFSLFVCLLEPCSLPSMTLPSCKPQMVCFIKAFFCSFTGIFLFLSYLTLTSNTNGGLEDYRQSEIYLINQY